jgi:hypothetical protein
MQLRCPEAGSGSDLEHLRQLAPMSLECVDLYGKRLRLVPYLGGVEVPAPSYFSSGPSGPKLDGGSAAGLVIGLLAALAALAALAYFVGYKRYYKERRAQGFDRMQDEGLAAQPAARGEAAGSAYLKDPAAV